MTEVITGAGITARRVVLDNRPAALVVHVVTGTAGGGHRNPGASGSSFEAVAASRIGFGFDTRRLPEILQ